MAKTQRGFSPQETTIDDIPYDRRAAFVRDQRKTAVLAAGNIDDRVELCDVLEMLGLELKFTARA
jgi:hypothetical protein